MDKLFLIFIFVTLILNGETFAQQFSQQTGIEGKYLESSLVGDLNPLKETKDDDYTNYSDLATGHFKSKENIQLKIAATNVAQKDYSLFLNGKSDYRIILSAQASESERWAAKELQHWLKEISGVDLPIQNLDQPLKGHQIVIGYNAIIKEKTGGNAPVDLDESFRYCNSGPDILIYGGKIRGTMYGVMSFLENEFGCRWYTPAVSLIPLKESFSFSNLDHSEKPGIRVRNDFYFEAFNPIWAARNRINGTTGYRKQPGGVQSYWGVHTFYKLMPPLEFYDKHPEYYSLIYGKRMSEKAQLCLSNPAVLKIVIERIKKRIQDSPQYLIYDVSQNDYKNPCQCEKCQAIVNREGGESGLIIWFVNQVAEAIEKDFPDKFIGTLAYTYSRNPPKTIRPRNNIVVRLSTTECCFAHDIKSCPQNQSFLEDLKNWSSLAPHLYIWDYVVNFHHYIMPYPNFKVLQPNIQIFREYNSIGIMEQGDWQSRGGEFSELKTYLISRLLWNPDCDADEVINDFMVGYYGSAGMYIKQYFDLLQSRITTKTHIHKWLSPNDPIFSVDFVKEASKIMDKAVNMADNEEIRNRVEMASMPVLYLRCQRTPALARKDGSYKKINMIAKRERITHFAEAGDKQRVEFKKFVESAK